VDRQTDRQTDKTDRQTDRQTDKQTDKTDRQAEYVCTCVYVCVHAQCLSVLCCAVLIILTAGVSLARPPCIAVNIAVHRRASA
jgi:hypothetical protein